MQPFRMQIIIAQRNVLDIKFVKVLFSFNKLIIGIFANTMGLLLIPGRNLTF
jgi:hypothetical protein